MSTRVSFLGCFDVSVLFLLDPPAHNSAIPVDKMRLETPLSGREKYAYIPEHLNPTEDAGGKYTT